MAATAALSMAFLAIVLLGVLPAGTALRWTGVISFLLMFMDLAFFVIGVRDFGDNTFNMAVRILAVLVPGVAFAAYILVYMAGILVG